MLSGRLNDTASGKARVILLLAALAGSIGVAAIAFSGYLNLSSELELQAELASNQKLEIQAHSATIEAQALEIEMKSAELAEIQAQASRLSEQLSETERVLGEQSENARALEDELKNANEQAGLLNAEISALQSKIRADEQRIQDLIRQQSQSDRITVSHYGLGVDQNDRGMVFPIKVEIIESGAGILSVDINSVQYEPGFQLAVRSAATAASQYSGVSIHDKDIIVRFASGGTQVGPELIKVDGSSAGAIISAMIAAGLADKELDSSIMVTGSMGDDGRVGRVGGLQEKLAAADAFGAEAMLVPDSQKFESDTIPVIGVSDISELMELLGAS